jgi:hypothetical protein
LGFWRQRADRRIKGSGDPFYCQFLVHHHHIRLIEGGVEDQRLGRPLIVGPFTPSCLLTEVLHLTVGLLRVTITRKTRCFLSYVKRPLINAPFCPISLSGSNFNPRNIPYIPAVEIFAFLDLGQN